MVKNQIEVLTLMKPSVMVLLFRAVLSAVKILKTEESLLSMLPPFLWVLRLLAVS